MITSNTEESRMSAITIRTWRHPSGADHIAIPEHLNGGYALPGGEVVEDQDKAVARMKQHLKAAGWRKKEVKGI